MLIIIFSKLPLSLSLSLSSRLPNVSYSLKTRRLAVGSGSGQVGIYDLKQRKTQMINAHTHQVIVLSFSEEGKHLATYSYGDSTLRVWQVRPLINNNNNYYY